jgi:hypothetical protein
MKQADPYERHALPAVRVPLTDALCMAECVDSNGTTSLWLLACDDDGTLGCACRNCAPHEATGRLPREVRDRLGLVARCGARTHAGTPCRTVVSAPGVTCGVHKAKAVR